MTDLFCGLQEGLKTDILFYANRYNIFVRWSADQEHPWDAASSQTVPAAVLEVGFCR